MERQTVIVLDFGGQYNQLIARRVRECNVYCEVHPYTLSLEKIKEMKEIVPISYIARNYFGKSTAWLQQRIYGYKVRGRVYTLSEQDRLIFNNAIHDICNKLGSLSIA